jgi:outer membrane protein OmpA-like peptidoglycan-associated protein
MGRKVSTYGLAAIALAAAALATGPVAAHAAAGRHGPAVHTAHHPAMSEATRRLLMRREFVWFDNDSFALSPDAMRGLARFAGQLRADQRDVRIEAVGFADSTGTDPHNLLLAERRATAVLHYLHVRGVSLLRMSAASYGEGMPMMSNATADGRASNRRVVVVVLPWKSGPRQT